MPKISVGGKPAKEKSPVGIDQRGFRRFYATISKKLNLANRIHYHHHRRHYLYGYTQG